MNKHNWNLYREQFPVRYWEEGLFDEKLTMQLNRLSQSIKKGLDVGCGVLGTLALKDFAIKNNVSVDMLDPFVDNKPSWMHEKVTWENINKYDLIIARGSINYLTSHQMQKLEMMLNNNGILMANTFLIAPSKEWSERETKNASGEVGIEKSRLVGNIVEHRIIFKDYDISHNFYYYSEDDYRKIFKNIEFITYAKNSTLLIVKKNNI